MFFGQNSLSSNTQSMTSRTSESVTPSMRIIRSMSVAHEERSEGTFACSILPRILAARYSAAFKF